MSEYADPYVYRCSACNCLMDERVDTVWEKVEGWVKPRDAGGPNALSLRKPLGVFMCDACMSKLRAGLSVDQMVLG